MKQSQTIIRIGVVALLALAAVLILPLSAGQMAGVPATSDEMPVQLLTILLVVALAVLAGLTLYGVLRQKPGAKARGSHRAQQPQATEKKDGRHE